MGFLGVGEWELFDEICEGAEAARDRAVREATVKRDHFVNSISGWRVESRERVRAAAEVRYAGKVKDAEEQRQAPCRSAEQDLLKALDQLVQGDQGGGPDKNGPCLLHSCTGARVWCSKGGGQGPSQGF